MKIEPNNLEAIPIELFDIIKAGMIEVVNHQPIINTGSYAKVLLWQIYEAAFASFDHYKEIEKIDDDLIDSSFDLMFPSFVQNYPQTTSLSQPTTQTLITYCEACEKAVHHNHDKGDMLSEMFGYVFCNDECRQWYLDSK